MPESAMKAPPEGRRRITREEWIAEAKRRFGKDPKKWRFRCVVCGHEQSAEEVIERNPELEGSISTWIYFSCEGRFTAGGGCDWTLGGLLQLHTLEVEADDGEIVPVFEFADPEPGR